jgi:hypothetical protein
VGKSKSPADAGDFVYLYVTKLVQESLTIKKGRCLAQASVLLKALGFFLTTYPPEVFSKKFTAKPECPSNSIMLFIKVK